MKILVTRHGQTDWNLENRIQGWSDNPINETGNNQAHLLHDQIKNIKFDICYSSPLLRAAKTAQIALGYDNPEIKPICPIRYDKRIRERGFGEIESKTVEEVKEFIFNESWDLDLNSGKYGIEPIREIYRRVHEFIDTEIPRVKAEFGDNATILIVSHGGTSRVINYVLLGGDIVPDKNSEVYKRAQSFVLPNCGIAEYNI